LIVPTIRSCRFGSISNRGAGLAGQQPGVNTRSVGPDARLAEFKSDPKVAATRIDNARHEGASLYLTDIDQWDLAQLILQVEDLIPAWLEGMDSRAADFRRRVRLAEGAYLALCEALLHASSRAGRRIVGCAA